MKAIPSRADPDKWGCSQCDYGHDVGKSRNAVYKHWKKNHELSDFDEKSQEKSQARSTTFSMLENLHKIGSTEESETPTDYVQNPGDLSPEESVKNDTSFTESDGSIEWGSVDWDESTPTDQPPKARTIPKPLSDMAQGNLGAVSSAAQGQVIRFAFMSLDRLLTHYGRGVMSKPDWEVERTREDYDTLESSTMMLMEHYGLSVGVSPLMVWTATVGTAYAPPLMHIRKNADPNRKGRIGGLLRRLIPRRRKKKKEETEDDPRTDA